MKKRFIMLGIDGLSFENWPKFANEAVMPNSLRLFETAEVRRMYSSIPEVSSTAWSSIVTGTDAGSHNVFGFTDIIDNTYTLGFTSFRTLKAKPFWRRDDEKQYLIMNVPQTYPAERLPGALVSGYVALDLERSVYPPGRIQSFKDAGYRIDVDMSLLRTSKQSFLTGLSEVLAARMEMLHTLWAEQFWDVLMFVITGTDRLCHYFWDRWEDANAPYRREFLAFFEQVDEAIGRILNMLSDGDTLVLVSDHGFERQRLGVNINAVLCENGYLGLQDSDRPSYASILPESKAFCMDPGRIYLHRKDRYPSGSVEECDVDALLTELIDLFSAYSIGGEPIVGEVLRGADIYHGPYGGRAPDLVLMGAPGVAFSGRVRQSPVIEQTEICGKHRFDDAVFSFLGPSKPSLPERIHVEDVLGIARSAGAL